MAGIKDITKAVKSSIKTGLEGEEGKLASQLVKPRFQRLLANEQPTTQEILDAPIQQVVEGVKQGMDLIEGPRQQIIQGLAEQLDLGRRSMGDSPEFQETAKETLDLALPSSLDVVGPVGRFGKILGAAEKVAPKGIRVLEKQLAREATGVGSLAQNLERRGEDVTDFLQKPSSGFGRVKVIPTAEQADLARLEKMDKVLPSEVKTERGLALKQFLDDPKVQQYLEKLKAQHSNELDNPLVKKTISNAFDLWKKAKGM
jgi:hypothetical protein